MSQTFTQLSLLLSKTSFSEVVDSIQLMWPLYDVQAVQQCLDKWEFLRVWKDWILDGY